MKAFEQIQKEGPKRPKELHPEKRSRRRSAKSESTESRAVMLESTVSKAVTSDPKAVMSESKTVTSDLRAVMSESKAVMSESAESKAVMSESKTVRSESTESKAVTSESQPLMTELLASKTVTSQWTESKPVMSESTTSKAVTSESRASKAVASESSASKRVEDEGKGPSEEMSLAVKKEPPPGSAVDEEDAENLAVNAGDVENRDVSVNLIDEDVTTSVADQNAREKFEVKCKEEDDGEWTDQVEENDFARGDIRKTLPIAENVKDEEEEKKLEFQGVQLDLGESKGECEITVKKEEEEIPPKEEDGRLELEHQLVEAEARPSTVTPTDPQKSGKCSEAVVTGEQLSKIEMEDHVAMEMNDSSARSEAHDETLNLERVEEPKDELTLSLRRSKRRQPSGASQPELPSQAKESAETVIKEPALDTIPDCGVPSVEENNVEPLQETDTVVKPIARSKGRPRKIMKVAKGEKVSENAGKEPDEKKPAENKFEHRVRTRSCTKEANPGVVASKAKPLGRKVSIANLTIPFVILICPTRNFRAVMVMK